MELARAKIMGVPEMFRMFRILVTEKNSCGFRMLISDGVSEEGALPARRVSMASRIPVSDLAFIVVDSNNEYISCYFGPRTLRLGCEFARYNDVVLGNVASSG